MPQIHVPPEDRLLAPREVCRILGINPVTLRRWREDQKITGLPGPGGHNRYRQSEVEQIRAAREAAR